MKLANKPMYPVIDWEDYSAEPDKAGITYKEALVLALAGNSMIVSREYSIKENAEVLLLQVNEIIKQMELK